MRRRLTVVALAVTGIVALVVVVALGATILLDVERHRGLIETKAEELLGRDVRFGEARVSFFPVLGVRVDDLEISALPGEGEGNVLEASSLRVGARLWPLLRKRLEVTSIVVDDPSLALVRQQDGRWNVQQLVASGEEGAEAPSFAVERLRVRRGRLTVRDAFGDGPPLELQLEDMELAVDDLAMDRAFTVDVAAVPGSMPGARLRFTGRIGPLEPPAGTARTVAGSFEARRLDPRELVRVVRTWPTLSSLSGDLLGERAFDVAAGIDASLGDAPSLALRGVAIDGLELRATRGADGTWDAARALRPGAAADAAPGAEPAPAPGLALRISDVSLKNGAVRLTAASRDGSTRTVALSGIELAVEGSPFDAAAAVRIEARVEGRPAGRIVWRGELGPLATESAARAAGRLEASSLDPGLVELLAPDALPAGLLGPRPVTLAAGVEIVGAERVDLRDVELSGAELILRRGRDGAWNAASLGQGGADGLGVRVSNLSVRGVRVTIVDDAAASKPAEGALDDVRLTLERFPLDAPSRIEAAATLTSGGTSSPLALRGSLGPLADESLAFDVSLAGEGVPLAALGPALPAASLDVAAARSSVDLALSGRWPDRVAVRGRAGVRGASVILAGLDGKARRAPLDVDAQLDLDAARGGDALTFRSVALSFPERPAAEPLTVAGSLARAGDGLDMDLTVAAPRVAADDLAALLALAGGELPFTFAASEPVALRARLSGRLDEKRTPDVEGTAKLAGFSVRHPAMSAPLERLSAKASFSGQRVELADLRGVIGSSDLAGRLAVTLGTPLRIRADIRSEKADVWELLSFIQTEDAGAAAAPAAGGFDPMRDVALEGSLAVGRGTFHTLEFSSLDTGLRFENGRLTLSPLSAGLYGGTFKGSLEQRLDTSPVSSVLAGDAAGVDVAPFLAANLGLKDVLSGRATARLDVTTTGAGFEPIVRGLAGTGKLSVENGTVGRLDVLRSLSKVTGVFGETTLRRVSRQLATSGTEFTSLGVGLSFAGGRMTFRDLELVAPEFSLLGVGAIDMLAASLDGEFVASFAPEVSASMRAEGSRAASVFWNAATERVDMPFGLRGPVDAPQPVVEWKKIAGDVLRRKMSAELERLVGGRSRAPRETAPPPQAAPAPDAQEAPAPAPEPGAALAPAAGEAPAPPSPAPPADPAALAGSIDPPRWSSSLLAPSLRLSGVARGRGLARASLEVRDANGLPVLRVDRLPAVAEHARTAADASAPAEVRWKAEVDGKKLLVVKFPLTATLVVFDGGGATAEAQAQIDR